MSAHSIKYRATQQTEWPWNDEAYKPYNADLDRVSWPRISVVTPSYNQGAFLEEAIRSVLLQGYPNLEYIIVDGGSTDNSLDVINRYSKWLTYWTSEVDSGQANAINKGFSLATGEIFCWLNSDDLLASGALYFVAQYFIDNPNVHLIYGTAIIIDDDKNEIRTWRSNDFSLESFVYSNYICQPASFFTSLAYNAVGGLKEELHYALDYDLWLRIALSYVIKRVDPILGYDRKQLKAKTMKHPERLIYERIAVIRNIMELDLIPLSIREFKSHILSIHYFRAALDFLVLPNSENAVVREFLLESFLADPGFSPASYDWSKWILVHASRDSAEYPDEYISKAEQVCNDVFGKHARHWKVIRRRARVISITRRRLRLTYFVRARHVLISMISDTAWSFNRVLFPDLVRIIIGEYLFKIIYNIKRRLYCGPKR